MSLYCWNKVNCYVALDTRSSSANFITGENKKTSNVKMIMRARTISLLSSAFTHLLSSGKDHKKLDQKLAFHRNCFYTYVISNFLTQERNLFYNSLLIGALRADSLVTTSYPMLRKMLLLFQRQITFYICVCTPVLL